MAEVVLFALGGTIAMPAVGHGGVIPRLEAADLLGGLEGAQGAVRVSAETVSQVASAALDFAGVAVLAERARAAVASGAAGVVVAQGTDTLEETAFLLDLLLDMKAPVVVTGALRHPGLPGADGAGNLDGAIRVAVSPQARESGVLVVMNDEIHAARFVTKAHTHRPSAFASPALGPLGWITEGRVRVALKPARRLPNLDFSGWAPEVALVPAAFGDQGGLLQALSRRPPAGIVVQAMGAGHVPPALLEPLSKLAERMPVVLASRTGAGEGFRSTYGYAGGEIDLLSRGLIPAGALDGPKARILLTLLLSENADRACIRETFETL